MAMEGRTDEIQAVSGANEVNDTEDEIQAALGTNKDDVVTPHVTGSDISHEEDFAVSELIFRDLNVKIGDKQILKDVCGLGQQGQLLAIMGPSGAGKTTLLNTLSGRIPVESGEITFKGETVSRKLRKRICYVLQQDIFFPNLTLRDTLLFAACIRMSDELSYSQKIDRLNEVIDSLHLRNCLDTLMGGPMMPGLSGGERKRANIACELLNDPELILLDEPTTGLDSSTAYTMMQNLKSYAVSNNKTVIATIHQPSSQLFYQFDNLLLLCDGQTAYFGKTEKVVHYFREIDIPVTRGYNPADFILDQMKSCDFVKDEIITAWGNYRATENWPRELRGKSHDHDESASPTMLRSLTKTARKQPNFRSWKERKKQAASDEIEPGSIHSSLMELDDVSIETNQKFPTTFFTQYKYLTIRTFKESRSRILNKLKIVENLVICAFFTLIWFQLPRTEDTLRDRMGAVFFITVHWGFTPLFDAVSSFPMEQVVIYKERASGWYRLSAYYLAKMTSELPLTFIQPLVFVVISYWIIGLNGVTAFFATLGIVLIDSLAGQSIGLFLGIMNKDMRSAITLGILIEMAIMLLGGLFTRNLPFWLSWMQYLSFVYYAFHCLMYMEFKDGGDIQCSDNTNSSVFAACKDGNATSVPSRVALDYYDVKWQFWEYFLPLLLFIVVFRILGYLALRFYHRPHK